MFFSFFLSFWSFSSSSRMWTQLPNWMLMQFLSMIFCLLVFKGERHRATLLYTSIIYHKPEFVEINSDRENWTGIALIKPWNARLDDRVYHFQCELLSFTVWRLFHRVKNNIPLECFRSCSARTSSHKARKLRKQLGVSFIRKLII